MQEFKERRENILSIFTKAKADLEQLNADIDAQVAENKGKIDELSAKNNELLQLKTENNSTAKTFAKLFK